MSKIANMMKIHREKNPGYEGTPCAPIGKYSERDDPPTPWDDWGPEAQERTLKPLAKVFKEWNRKFARDL